MVDRASKQLQEERGFKIPLKGQCHKNGWQSIQTPAGREGIQDSLKGTVSQELLTEHPNNCRKRGNSRFFGRDSVTRIVDRASKQLQDERGFKILLKRQCHNNCWQGIQTTAGREGIQDSFKGTVSQELLTEHPNKCRKRGDSKFF